MKRACADCGAPISLYADLDGNPRIVERAKDGDITIIARSGSTVYVGEYFADEDDGTDVRLRAHACARKAAA